MNAMPSQPGRTTRPDTTYNAITRSLTRQAELDQTLIYNPLRDIEDDEIRTIAAGFHAAHLTEVVDKDIFVRGALLAKESTQHTRVKGLTAIESVALQAETTTSFWQQIKNLPKEFRIILVTCCFAAIVQGWNQSNIAGANLTWPTARDNGGLGLHGWSNTTISDPNNSKDSEEAIWSFGAINAAAFFSASFIGCWLNDPLCEYFYGRRGALGIAAIFSFAAAIGGAYANSVATLAVCRVLTGIGMGTKASIVPVFAAETAPQKIRGSLVITWQTFDALGIMLGYAANLVVYDSWRKQIASAFIPAIPLLILVPLCVESPRWLYKKGKVSDAYLALKLLRETPVQACRDLFYTHVQLQLETKYFKRSRKGSDDAPSEKPEDVARQDDYASQIRLTSWWSRFLQLFRDRRTRRAAIQAFMAMAFQQASGINVLAFLGPTVFAAAFKDQAEKRALWMSFGFGLANFLFTWPAWGTIDRRGRRFLLNISLWNMAWTLLGFGLAFLLPVTNPARIPLIAIFFLLFTLAYSPGAGPLAFTISAEVFPLVNREVGMSLAVFVNLFGAGLLALTVPQLTKAMTPTGLLCMFAGFNVICAIVAYFFIRETAEYSLEDLNQIFEIPTSKHFAYQRYRLRTFVRSIFARGSSEPPDPFITWYVENTHRKRARSATHGNEGPEVAERTDPRAFVAGS